MDPLSITVSVSSLLVVAARVVKVIHDVRGDYKDAALMLSSIASECTVVHAALARLQTLMLADSQALESRLTPQVTAVFETALLGCALTLSVIDEELGRLVEGAVVDNHALKPKMLKYIIEKDRLMELLQQIRGQQVAITLLLTTYQTESITDISKSVQDSHIILQQIARRARSLWQESQHGDSAQGPPEIICGDRDSVFELSSIITDTRFDFDDEILNSRAYRQALANLRWSTELGKPSIEKHALAASTYLEPPDDASLVAGEDNGDHDGGKVGILGESSNQTTATASGMGEARTSRPLQETPTATSHNQNNESSGAADMDAESKAGRAEAPSGLYEHVTQDHEVRDIAASDYDNDDEATKVGGLQHTRSYNLLLDSTTLRTILNMEDLLRAVCDVCDITKHFYLSNWNATGEGKYLANEVKSLQKVLFALQNDPDLRETTIPALSRAACDITRNVLRDTVFGIMTQLHSLDPGYLRKYWESNKGTSERATISDLQDRLAEHGRDFEQYIKDLGEPVLSSSSPDITTYEAPETFADSPWLSRPSEASKLPPLNQVVWPFQTSALGPEERGVIPLPPKSSPESVLQLSPQPSVDVTCDTGHHEEHVSPTIKPGEQERSPAALLPSIKVVLIGDCASGKTSIIQRKRTGKRQDDFVSTIRDKFLIRTTFNALDGGEVQCQLEIDDTAGSEDYDRIRPYSYPGVHVILICFSIWSSDSLDNVFFKWFAEARRSMPQQPIILVGTQTDCHDLCKIEELKKTSRKPVAIPDAQEARCKLGAVKYLECSAWTGDGIDNLWEEVARIGWEERKRNPHGAAKARKRFWPFSVEKLGNPLSTGRSPATPQTV